MCYPQQMTVSSMMERKQGITLGFYFQIFTDLPRLITSYEVCYWVLKQVKTLICPYELNRFYCVVIKSAYLERIASSEAMLFFGKHNI